MKLITFSHAGQQKVGQLSDDGATIVDLTATGLAASMNDLIDRYDHLRPQIAAVVQSGTARVARAEVELLAPIPVPRRNVFCVGKNYHDHAREFANSGFDSSANGSAAVPDEPIIFSKPPSSVCGPGAPIDSALDPYDSVDYEAELALVIGKKGRVRADDDPWSFVFGITLINDVTSRELQKRHKQWLLGKGIDNFCPMGPTIVTRDEIADVGALDLRCFVNDELRQSAPVAHLIFDIPTLIRTIGRSISLEPGDLIATGTPAGVGIGYTPPKYLKPGDVVRVEMHPVGVLENRII